MKHLMTYNESLRDKMTPKSSEDINNILKTKTPDEIFKIGVELKDLEIIRSAFEKNINLNIPEPILMVIVDFNDLDIAKTILDYRPESIYKIIKVVLHKMHFSTVPRGAMYDTKKKLEPYLELSNIPRQELLDKSLIYLCHANMGNGIKLLYEMGADIHRDNEEPLMQSIYNGKEFSVKTLLSLGADPTINHNRPLEEAKRRKYDDIVDIISKHISNLPLRKRLSRYLPFLKESLRDKMTPISDDTLNQKVDDRINRYKSLLGIFDYKKYGWEMDYEKSRLSGNDPYYIFVDKNNNHWVLRLERFTTNNMARIQFGASVPNKISHSTKYFYHFSDLEKYLDELGIEKTNESVRDMMTPKSEEEINNNWDKSVDEMIGLIIGSYKITRSEAIQFLKDHLKTFQWRLLHDGYSVKQLYREWEFLLYNRFGEDKMKFNESVRNMMTPKSKEDIKISLNNLDPESKIKRIITLKILDYFTNEEIKEILNELDDNKKIEIILKNKLFDYYTRPELRDLLDKIENDFSIILQSDKFINLLSIEKFQELKDYIVEQLMNKIKFVSFYKDKITGKYVIGVTSYRFKHNLAKYGNGIYVVLGVYDFADLKLYITKKNVAFAEISSTEYKIWSHDKIRIVLDKLVDDVLNGRKEEFTLIKFEDLMR